MSDMTREEAIKRLDMGFPGSIEEGKKYRQAVDMAISALSADVRPNIHGHWIKRTHIGNHETVTMNVCSECGEEFGWDIETGISISDNNFCPNCGADMREPKDILHKVIDNTTFAEEAYPNIKEELHKAVDMAESESK